MVESIPYGVWLVSVIGAGVAGWVIRILQEEFAKNKENETEVEK